MNTASRSSYGMEKALWEPTDEVAVWSEKMYGKVSGIRCSASSWFGFKRPTS